MVSRIVWLPIALLLVPAVTPAQNLVVDPRVASALRLVEIWVDSQLAYERIPGMSLGIVHDQPLGGETHVLVIDGQLATISVPTNNPMRSLTKYKQVGENTFKRVRDDGDLGEAVTFELGPDGSVTRLVRNSNYSIRVAQP